MSTQPTVARPEFGRLYGITYSPETKQAVVRTPRVLKVGIGIPKGRAIQVFLASGIWHIRHGVFEGSENKPKLVMKTVFKGGANESMPNTKEAAIAWHEANKDKAAVSNRPQKIPYFTFTRRTIIEQGGKPVEVFEPDWDAIEAHGDCPRRLPVILTSDEPLYQEDGMWSATELKCHGDGLLAERIIAMGSSKDAGWDEAKKAGQKMFLYSPCRLGGCPFAGKECKKHTTLNIQLAYALRLGATAYFTSTGDVTANQIFSSFTEIRDAVVARGYSVSGIPMDLVLGSFRANHEGKPTIQPCVSLELRAQGSRKLSELLAENSWVPSRLEKTTRSIAAPSVDSEIYDGTSETIAPGMAAEFSEDPQFDEDEQTAGEPDAASQAAAVASQAATDELSDKLKKAAKSSKKADAAPATEQPAATAPAQDITVASPWANRQDMNSALLAVKAKIGDVAFKLIGTKHSVILGTAEHNDPKVIAMYEEMVKASTEESGF